MVEKHPEPAKRIRVKCESCGKEYRITPQSIGKKAKCACGEIFVVNSSQSQIAAVTDPLELPSTACQNEGTSQMTDKETNLPLVFTGPCPEPHTSLGKHSVEVPPATKPAKRYAKAIEAARHMAERLGANGVYQLPTEAEYLRKPEAMEPEFVCLKAGSLTREQYRSQLTGMSKHLKIAGIGSIVGALINGGLLQMSIESQGRTDPRTPAEIATVVLVSLLLTEGVVLLIRRRPKQLVLDGLMLCLIGIFNLVFNVAVSFWMALGGMQIIWGVKSFLYYRRIMPVWSAAMAALDTRAADRAYILERHIKGLSTAPVETTPWSPAAASGKTAAPMTYDESPPICPRCGLQATPVRFFNHWKNIMYLILCCYPIGFPGYFFWKRGSERFACSRCGRPFHYSELHPAAQAIPKGRWRCPVCGQVQEGERFFKSSLMRGLRIFGFVMGVIPGLVFWLVARQRIRCLGCRHSSSPTDLNATETS